MKKFSMFIQLLIGWVIFPISDTYSASSTPTKPGFDPITPTLCTYDGCMYGTPDSLCTDYDSCSECKGSTSTTSNGVRTTKTGAWTGLDCSSVQTTAEFTCYCKYTYTYSCASGYYGTATSSGGGCTKCPSNATCAGGNQSTFVCNAGYYSTGSGCAACPTYGTLAGTSSPGATSASDCYIPSGSTYPCNDTRGDADCTITPDCSWK